MRYFQISRNDLHGELAKSIALMTKIVVFDISENPHIEKYWPKEVEEVGWEDCNFISILNTALTSERLDEDDEIPSQIPRLCGDVPFCYRYMWTTHGDFTLADAEDFADSPLVQETLKLAMDNAKK